MAAVVVVAVVVERKVVEKVGGACGCGGGRL